ncbi:MAG: hypothetical protein BWY76_00798 [bacterium ADurb.Bin429]|nr:MAG: hypothetical protein BWY76_00798 [bacterium ADurb.Bin429]
MTPEHEAAVRRAAILAYKLASIEKSVVFAEQHGTVHLLPRIIADILADVASHAPDDMVWARKIAAGIYS